MSNKNAKKVKKSERDFNGARWLCKGVFLYMPPRFHNHTKFSKISHNTCNLNNYLVLAPLQYFYLIPFTIITLYLHNHDNRKQGNGGSCHHNHAKDQRYQPSSHGIIEDFTHSSIVSQIFLNTAIHFFICSAVHLSTKRH